MLKKRRIFKKVTKIRSEKNIDMKTKMRAANKDIGQGKKERFEGLTRLFCISPKLFENISFLTF